MRGLIQLQNTLSMIRENLNPDVDIEGILPTMVDTRTLHAKEAIEILEENFGDRVFASRIKKTVRFAEAPVKGMSVLKYDPDGVAAESYRQLAKEVLEWQAVSGRACGRARWPPCSARPRTRGRAGEHAPSAAAAAAEPRARARRAAAAAAARERPAAPALRSALRAGAASPRTCPRPQERLRHAFSSDIPENMMEPAPARRCCDDDPPPDADRARRRRPAGAAACCASSASAAPASTPSTA